MHANKQKEAPRKMLNVKHRLFCSNTIKLGLGHKMITHKYNSVFGVKLVMNLHNFSMLLFGQGMIFIPQHVRSYIPPDSSQGQPEAGSVTPRT